MTQLTVSGLDKSFGGRSVLSGVDLEVPENSLTAILGPSGSGKTTLLRVIVGFEHADGGTVRIGPTVVDGPGAHVPSERRRIGYVPQEGGLFPHLTVAANVGFGLPRRERRGKVIGDLLEAVGMAGLGHRYPHQLSGGQQQRVALARALAIKPDLVLLDEPFGSLDANLRATIRADVRRLLSEAGATAVLVTHDQDEALSTADQVAVLRQGKIVQCAAPQDLYTKPADPEVARFIGEANLVDGVFGQGSVETLLGALPVQDSALRGLDPGPVTVLVRPEQIEIGAWDGSRGLPGRIVALGYHGHDAVVHVEPEQRPPLASEPLASEFLASELLASEQPVAAREKAPIIVRTLGGCELPAGAKVTLRATGPVPAWPRSAVA